MEAKIKDRHGKGKKNFDNKVLTIIPIRGISYRLDEKFIHTNSLVNFGAPHNYE